MLEFLDEVTGFDKMPHDDQVDSFTQALIDLKVSDGQVSVSTLSGAGRASRVRRSLQIDLHSLSNPFEVFYKWKCVSLTMLLLFPSMHTIAYGHRQAC